jgi:hypothetical protein
MRARSVATILATLTLLAALLVGVFIAAPSIAQTLQQPAEVTAAGATPPATEAAATAPRPAVTSPSPTSTYSGPLIAPRGAHQITRRQLHSWVVSRPFAGEDPENDAIWEQQQWLDIQCMAGKGFLDDPTNPSVESHPVSTADGLTAKQAHAYVVAMDGPETDAPYDWRTAGCHGRSVHVTGQDNAH